MFLFYFISAYVVFLARESYSRIESDTGEELTVTKMMIFYTIVIGRVKVCLYFHFSKSLFSVLFKRSNCFSLPQLNPLMV